MQCFFIQFKCKLGQAYKVAASLAEMEIASEIYSTSGEYDLSGQILYRKRYGYWPFRQ